jgi:hypothetical protein
MLFIVMTGVAAAILFVLTRVLQKMMNTEVQNDEPDLDR